MASKLRQIALEADDIKKELVSVPQWGVEAVFEVRGISGEARAKLLSASQIKGFDDDDEPTTEVDSGKMIVALIIESAYDPETGEKVFTEADTDTLAKKSAEALDVIANVAMRLSGIGKKQEDRLKGNSDATPNATSPSV